MGRVVFARIASALPLLVATSFLVFLLLHWAPGTFLDQLRLHPGIDESSLQELARRYGLDRPWYLQYASWLGGLFRGDLGPSLRFQRPVRDLLMESVPRTLILAVIAQGAGLLLGIVLSLVSVRRLHGGWDRWACRAALTLLSVHPVVLSILGMSFAAATGILEIGGGSSFGGSSLPFAERVLDSLRYLVLPASILVLFVAPAFFLHARGVLAELLPSPSLRAARARGLSDGTLLLSHLLPLALVPLVSFAGSSVSRLLNGALLVEVVTGWPGMGRLALTALRERDSFLLLGTIFVSGVVLSLAALLSDLLLAQVDPRIRLEESAP